VGAASDEWLAEVMWAAGLLAVERWAVLELVVVLV
jgi:hypothetical protein